MMEATVFVSGATGFIGQHIIKLLLSKKYHVVGTVRSIEQGNHCQKQYDSKNFTYELVPEIGAENAFDNAFKRHPEVTIVIHAASPRALEGQNPELDILVPAVQSIQNLLSAIQKHGPQIEHVVVTSSAAASLDPERLCDPTYTISEKSWSPITLEQAKASTTLGYFGSKKFAEQAAWDFYEKEKPSYTLNTVNPTYVFGPQAFDLVAEKKLSFSAEIINTLINTKADAEIISINGGFVDVRYVAKAHLTAFERPFNKKRLLLNTEMFNTQELLEIIRTHFSSLASHLPRAKPNSGREHASESCKIDNLATQSILEIPLISLESSVIDTVTQILKAHKKEYSPPGMFLHKEHKQYRGPTTFE